MSSARLVFDPEGEPQAQTRREAVSRSALSAPRAILCDAGPVPELSRVSKQVLSLQAPSTVFAQVGRARFRGFAIKQG